MPRFNQRANEKISSIFHRGTSAAKEHYVSLILASIIVWCARPQKYLAQSARAKYERAFLYLWTHGERKKMQAKGRQCQCDIGQSVSRSVWNWRWIGSPTRHQLALICSRRISRVIVLGNLNTRLRRAAGIRKFYSARHCHEQMANSRGPGRARSIHTDI